jgi:hypothetical protein
VYESSYVIALQRLGEESRWIVALCWGEHYQGVHGNFVESDGSVPYLYCGGSCIHLSKFTVLCTKRMNFTTHKLYVIKNGGAGHKSLALHGPPTAPGIKPHHIKAVCFQVSQLRF